MRVSNTWPFPANQIQNLTVSIPGPYGFCRQEESLKGGVTEELTVLPLVGHNLMAVTFEKLPLLLIYNILTTRLLVIVMDEKNFHRGQSHGECRPFAALRAGSKSRRYSAPLFSRSEHSQA
jgi:hypothetical protein